MYEDKSVVEAAVGCVLVGSATDDIDGVFAGVAAGAEQTRGV